MVNNSILNACLRNCCLRIQTVHLYIAIVRHMLVDQAIRVGHVHRWVAIVPCLLALKNIAQFPQFVAPECQHNAPRRDAAHPPTNPDGSILRMGGDFNNLEFYVGEFDVTDGPQQGHLFYVVIQTAVRGWSTDISIEILRKYYAIIVTYTVVMPRMLFSNTKFGLYTE